MQFDHGQCVTTKIGNAPLPAPVPGPAPKYMPPAQDPGQAALRVRLTGPREGVVAKKSLAKFILEVENTGTATAKGVVLTSQLPKQLEYSTSNPSAREMESKLTWEVPELTPGRSGSWN